MSTDLLPIGDMTPRLLVKLGGNPNRVMQSFTRAPWEGTYFEAQVDDDASANMRISRCDTSGKVLDYAVLQGAGHGSSITAEYVDGKVWIWLWWQIDAVTGAQASPVRWAYQGTSSGAYVLLEDAEPVPDPDAAEPGHTWGQFAIDQAKDRVATYFRAGNTERFALWKLSDYKAGTGAALARATVTKPDNASFQGFTTSDTHAYIARGGSGVLDIAPTLYELDWSTGAITGSKDVSDLAAVAGDYSSGGQNEAEGVCLWRDQAGNPTLLFGVVTGPAQQREGRIYAMTAPVDGTATKTVRIDAENVTGSKAENVVASFRYSTTVRSTNGGFTPTSYEEPVKLSESDTVQLKVSDHPDLTDDCFGFVIYGRLDWDDPSNPGRRKTAAYTAQLSASDPDLVLLSQRLVASGAVAPGQVIKGAPGHSPVVTMVGDQIAVDGVVQGDHLTADATAAEQAAADAAASAQDAANSASQVFTDFNTRAPALDADDVWDYAISDTNGRVALGIDKTGAVNIAKLRNPAQFTDQLDAETLNSMITGGGSGTPTGSLTTFTNALMHADTKPCDILFVGDSFIEGVGATSITTSMVNRIRDKLRAQYPSGAAGGYGWKPGRAYWTPGDDFVTGNLATVNANHGIGLRGEQMSASGQGITITQAMTSIDIVYTQSASSGSFSYAVDGGTATTVSANGAQTEGKKVSITGLTAGSHTVVISWVSGGAVVIEGVMIYNGDETKGIRTWNGGRGSTQTSTWATNTAWRASVTANVPTPALVVICLGVNDWAGTGYTPIPSATTATNLQTIVAAIRSATTSNPSIMVTTQYPKQGSGLGNAIEPWSNYRDAIAGVVAADPTLIPFDMTTRFGDAPAVASDGSTLVTDSVHPNDAGQQLWAATLARTLLPA